MHSPSQPLTALPRAASFYDTKRRDIAAHAHATARHSQRRKQQLRRLFFATCGLALLAIAPHCIARDGMPGLCIAFAGFICLAPALLAPSLFD